VHLRKYFYNLKEVLNHANIASSQQLFAAYKSSSSRYNHGYNPPSDSTCSLNLNDFAFRVPTKDWHETRRISIGQFEHDFPCKGLVKRGLPMSHSCLIRANNGLPRKFAYDSKFILCHSCSSFTKQNYNLPKGCLSLIL
jgi:hypothetical protein